MFLYPIGSGNLQRVSLIALLIALPVAMLTSVPVASAPARGIRVDRARLDARLRELEHRGDGGRVAVLLADPRDNRVLYIYNADYVLRRVFPPGSLLKPLAAAVLLENSSFDPGRRILCRGRFSVPERMLERRDWRTLALNRDRQGGYLRCIREGHGQVNLRLALVHSCNVYFLTAARTHPELYPALRSRWRLFGTTGSSGLGQERGSLSSEPDALSRMQRIAATIGEGGSLRLTPLKIAQVYASLFTGSALLRPLSSRYRNGTGTGSDPARAQFPRPFARASLRRISSILGQVPDIGTLRGLKFPGQEGRLLAAKTGTATHFRRKYANHGWNVIHGTHRNSPFLLVVFVENGSGGKKARQVSERIMGLIE